METTDAGKEYIVIIGGGIIGCCTAYYLTRHPSYDPEKHSVILLESTRLAGGASGKAGGLLAQWAYPASLVRVSFDLHSQLAEEHNGASAWGYRSIRCGKLTARDRGVPADRAVDTTSWIQQVASWVLLGKRKEISKDPAHLAPVEGLPDDMDWFRPECVEKFENIAPKDATAQLQPYQFTHAMAKLAEERGARVIIGAAEEIEYTVSLAEDTRDATNDAVSQPRKVCGVRYVDKATAQATTISTSIVILAAGPWSPTLFPLVPMSAMRAHSITIRTQRPLSPYCLFSDITSPDPSANSNDPPGMRTRQLCPEIYSRPNNEVYVAGEGDRRVPLPPTTDDVEVDRGSCQLIIDAVTGVSDELRSGLVTSRRACYLPTVDLPSGGPLIGPTHIDGLLLATGHSCWGIQNAPATGKLISEIVFDGEAKSADISALDPRLMI